MRCGDDVGWHFEAEIVSAAFLGIIWVYSHENNMVHTLRNWIFRGCFFSIFFSISVNIFGMILVLNRSGVSPAFLLAARDLHYVVTPFSTVMCQLYTLAFVHEEIGKSPKKSMWLSLIPYAAFLVLVLTNPMTGALFTVNVAGEFTNGFLFPLVYVFYYVYCLMMAVWVYANRNLLSLEVRKVLFLFPLIISLAVFVQQLFPQVLFSGSVSVSVLLIAYLCLQNKRISEDQLTGLPNRFAYLKMLNFLIEKKRTIMVMVVSLNDFKFINDKFGQANGDLFLISIADFLKTVVPANCVYRFGGDQFAVIFERYRLETAGTDICAIADRFTHPWDIPDCSCRIEASIGVAHYPASADNCRELVSMLESAVERAKKTGGALPVFCDKEIIEHVRRRNILNERMHNALQNDEFEVYYQPLYSVREDRFTEMEALVRLRDEDGKFISAEEFIPLAEETGLIVNIGYVVLKKVCKYIRYLLQQGIEIETVSVNLSVVQLMKADIVPRVLQIIRGSGISPNRIIFEITESILVSNYAMVAEKIRSLSEAGIRFALDDFGTGYSNFTHVIDLPFDVVKIDKSLIWDSMDNPKCYILVRNMSNTFKNMDLLVTAEGVETPEQDSFVRLCGCDRIQGYRYARPLPKERSAEYMGRKPSQLIS